jgi:hypothetical protein
MSVEMGAEAQRGSRSERAECGVAAAEVLQSGRVRPVGGGGGAAGKAAARRPPENATWVDCGECFQTDSCGSCGQLILWCKCVTSTASQRTARAKLPAATPAAQSSPVSTGTPVSSVWSSEEEKDRSWPGDDPDQFGLGGRQEHQVVWTRTSLYPYPVRDRAPSVEGRELSELKSDTFQLSTVLG